VFEAARILAGVPRLGFELTDRTIPQEGGDEFVARTVSFTKGCYTGQELVARLDSRGSNVPTRIRLVRGQMPASGALPRPGAKIEAGGVEAGELTSTARLGEAEFVALALVKRAYVSESPVEAELINGAGRVSVAVSSPSVGTR
jgi:folate-binding protein YgfZ